VLTDLFVCPQVGVGGGLPGGQLGVEDVEILDAPVEASALAGQRGKFDLGDVEPRAALGV